MCFAMNTQIIIVTVHIVVKNVVPLKQQCATSGKKLGSATKLGEVIETNNSDDTNILQFR